MKTFTEMFGKNTDVPSTEKTFPTFEEAMSPEGKSCVSENVKKLIKELAVAGMTDMKQCHNDSTPMTAEGWLKECEGYMKECMESLDECMNECMK